MGVRAGLNWVLSVAQGSMFAVFTGYKQVTNSANIQRGEGLWESLLSELSTWEHELSTWLQKLCDGHTHLNLVPLPGQQASFDWFSNALSLWR